MLRISELHRQRQRVMARIGQRRRDLRSLGHDCHRHSRAWASSPTGLSQAFLAGFLLDQTRPLLPRESSPLKLVVLLGFRRLESFIRKAM
ncbi:MAG: hypothetical protein EA370_01335 [Wenzhouxiangella sp.]|nr:MAG: hypothetical protein EA370_01335 [Wenzhouxiangella sp.]